MKYYLIKSNSEENVSISYNNSCWATSDKNSVILSQALDKGPVTLIFGINKSSKFCGYARMLNKPGSSSKHDIFKTSTGKYLDWKLFDIEWIHYADLSYSKTENILNSMNLNKPIKIGKDCQEIDSFAAQQLIDLYKQSTNSHKTEENNTYNTQETSTFKHKDITKELSEHAILKLAASTNPALSIFPIDLTALTYEQYIQIYQKSSENEKAHNQATEAN